jgi:dolichyl-phosphate-mannose--protein O-mannosyl transferase
MLAVFIALVSLYLPWVLVSRIAFIYHFFPVLPFVMLSIVYVLKSMSEKYRGWCYIAYIYLAGVAVLFVVFYPALSGMEVSQGYIEHLKWLKSWYF